MQLSFDFAKGKPHLLLWKSPEATAGPSTAPRSAQDDGISWERK
jgi:hypothetical protein